MEAGNALSYKKKHFIFRKRTSKKAKIPKAVVAAIKKATTKAKDNTTYCVQTIAGWSSPPSATTPCTVLVNPGEEASVFADATSTTSGFGVPYNESTVIGRVSDYMKMIRYRARFSVDVESGHSFNIRFILYYDKMNKASQPNVNQVLDTQDALWSLHNIVNVDFKKRFKIIHDKTYACNNENNLTIASGTTNTFQAKRCIFDIDEKLDMVTGYNRGQVGTYADIDTGALVLGIVTDDDSSGIGVLWMSQIIEVAPFYGRGSRAGL